MFNSVVVFPFFWVVVGCLVVGLIDCGGLASLVLMLICLMFLFGDGYLCGLSNVCLWWFVVCGWLILFVAGWAGYVGWGSVSCLLLVLLFVYFVLGIGVVYCRCSLIVLLINSL